MMNNNQNAYTKYKNKKFNKNNIVELTDSPVKDP